MFRHERIEHVGELLVEAIQMLDTTHEDLASNLIADALDHLEIALSETIPNYKRFIVSKEK